MQTLILTNPVARPSRPDVPPSDRLSAELLGEAFAGLLAEDPGKQSPADLTGPLSLHPPVAAPSESVLPVRLEPIGAVQSLAETAVMAADMGRDGLLIPKALQMEQNAVVSGEPVAKAQLLISDPLGWVPAAVGFFSVPTPLPQGGAQSALGHPGQLIPTRDSSGGNQSPKSGTSLPHLLLAAGGAASVDRLPLALVPYRTGPEGARSEVPEVSGLGLPEFSLSGAPMPEGATAKDSGSEGHGDPDAGVPQFSGKDPLLSAGSTMMEQVSPALGLPATGLQQHAWDDVLAPLGNRKDLRPDLWQPPSRPVIAPVFARMATDRIPPGEEVFRPVATGKAEIDQGVVLPQNAAPLGPALVTSAATGAAALWQAGLVAEADRNLPAAPENVDIPASSSPRMSIPAAMLLHYEGRAAPTLRLAEDPVSVLPVHVQPGDPDQDEMEAGLAPGVGTSPTHGGAMTATGHLAVSASLQDLPRLAAQLAATLVHRADGQTEFALSPEELGHVRLSMQADAQNPDRLVVMLTFERSETLDLFRRHADQLADALREAGYSGADISFGRSGGENARDGSEPDRPASPLHDTAGTTEGAPTHHLSGIAATGSLDLRL